MSVTNPTAFWNLNEASGNAVDDFGATYTLTDNNTVTNGAGKINNARYFASASSEYFSSTNAVFRVGDIDYSFAGWFYVADATARQSVFGKDISTDREYVLIAGNPINRATWTIFNGGGSAIQADTGAASISNSTWYFVAMYHDAAANQIGISLNGGSFATAATGGGHAAGGSASNFTMGRRDFVGAEDYVNGRLDAWGFWSGHVLSLAEVGELYNSGTGKEYPFTSASTQQRLMMMGVS